MPHYLTQDLLFTGTLSLLALLAGKLLTSRSIEITGLWFRLPLWLLVALVISLYTILLFSAINHFRYPIEPEYGSPIMLTIIGVSLAVSLFYQIKIKKKNSEE